MNSQALDVSASQPVAGSFADRIKLLIQRVGSATEIARMCGFSEGVVRSWRDGNTDPSRARCVTLARTLGISLVWLVAGEGAFQTDPALAGPEEQRSAEKAAATRRPQLPGMVGGNGMDAQRLNTAVRILQSEVSQSGKQLSVTDNAELLTQLYEILGPGGSHVDPLAMLAFNQQLDVRIRESQGTV